MNARQIRILALERAADTLYADEGILQAALIETYSEDEAARIAAAVIRIADQLARRADKLRNKQGR